MTKPKAQSANAKTCAIALVKWSSQEQALIGALVKKATASEKQEAATNAGKDEWALAELAAVCQT